MKALLAPKSLRALLFVATLNDQGVTPSRSDVNAFVEARTNLFDFDPLADGIHPRIVDYLVDARLLQSSSDGVTVSAAGLAILRAEDGPTGSASESVPVEVVGRMTDPFTYAQLLARIDDIPDALVIDPYLPAHDLATILRLTSVKRVLTRDLGAAGMPRAERAQKLRIALGARPDVQLRFLPSGSNELHDRLVLPSGPGEALLFGTSLGGTQLTVVTRIGRDATAALQGHYEELWAASTPVEPIARDAPDAKTTDHTPPSES
jgi:hypothetical protein